MEMIRNPNKGRYKRLHLDVCIDERTPRHGISELLKKLRPEWKPEDIQVKAFTEGITNQLMGCYVGSMTEDPVVLVRIYGQMTELFLDREKELEMFQVLHTHGCGPELFCSFRNGICYEFIRGVVLDDTLLRQPSVYRLIATEMGKIHSIQCGEMGNSTPGTPVLWSRLSQFLNLVQSSDAPKQQRSSAHVETPSLKIIITEMEELKTLLNHTNSPVVLCHNDLLTKNVIYNKEEGIDNVDSSLYPSRELQFDWLSAYLESFKSCNAADSTVSREEVLELYVQVCKFSLAAHLFWCLWALLQAKHSTIAFDFKRYAVARFNYYFEKKQEFFGMKLPGFFQEASAGHADI
ncbi:ethanolamine kinase 1 isoform X2 [Rhinichthys klamathensis goyatoka]|uniref:ethanolamine kinase 1 isoform X2 n=1 Tax=Rhinichthys klamathensis goyatoka TaxID=3034132 RepID=UPI0024B48CDE|nr:ethanolamine kinase 1 isoform X2 [Rhinichthys klamathensis goyatoka]